MIRVKVPGSLMLMGEHAVLQGELALALAVARYIDVKLVARADSEVVISSSLAQYRAALHNLTPEPKLSFVLSAIEERVEHLPSGFELSINSEFSHEVGLGSSAAVTAGVVAALSRFCGEQFAADALFERALRVVHRVQGGRGSGTDLVASIYGGLVAYRVEPREIRRLSGLPPIDLYYVGYKMKTPEVIARVETLAAKAPGLYSGIYRLMGETAEAAEAAIHQQEWALLGQLMNSYAGLMDALGVCDKALADLQYQLRDQADVLGVKISGSGLGDSVICLGQAAPQEINYTHIPVEISQQGLTIVDERDG